MTQRYRCSECRHRRPSSPRLAEQGVRAACGHPAVEAVGVDPRLWVQRGFSGLCGPGGVLFERRFAPPIRSREE